MNRCSVRLVAVAAALVAVLVAAANLAHAATATRAGCNANLAWQDRFPLWSPDSRWILYSRQEVGCDPPPESPHVLSASGRSDRTLWKAPKYAYYPWTWAPTSYVSTVIGGTDFLIRPRDGQVMERDYTPPPIYGPPGHVAFLGGCCALLADGHEVYFGAPLRDVAWSPDGTRLAFETTGYDGTSAIHVVPETGGSDTVVTTSAGTNDSITWSPDGRSLAWETNRSGGWQVARARADGSGYVALTAGRMPAWQPNVGRRIAFISDREGIPGGATRFQWALYAMNPDGSELRKLADDVHPFSNVTWSPSGYQIAYAAGRDCDRWGIYILTGERLERRVTNLCDFRGTPHADVLRGSPFSDRLSGLGGNDRIDGGAGRDTIDGGSGNDVIRARDGFRDTITCGPGFDRVYADRLDLVAGDCERVLRR